jgi:flavin reductase (DIM6/NTAB) family NADH-FMN oxidoreductase RutF
MFYEPRSGHGLPHDPFKAIVAPRPIGWISTLNGAGAVNLAPYSYFNALSGKPPLVWFSSDDGEKDSATAAAETGEFVTNLVSRMLAEKMNATSVNAPCGVNEFDHAGLTMGAVAAGQASARRRGASRPRMQGDGHLSPTCAQRRG